MNRFFKTAAVVTASAIALSACASSSSEVSASYISPITYDNYSCQQLSAELERITTRVRTVSGDVNANHTRDAIAMGVGLVIFWPALFLMKGNGVEATELASLKGEYDALQAQGVQKQCGFPVAAR